MLVLLATVSYDLKLVSHPDRVTVLISTHSFNRASHRKQWTPGITNFKGKDFKLN